MESNDYLTKKFHTKMLPVLSKDLNVVDGLGTIDEKITKLTECVELTAVQFAERRSICAELLQFLRKYYPNCLLLMFGSTVNNFALKTSNLNLLFLPYPGYCNLDIPKTENGEIPTLDAVLAGQVSQDALSKMDESKHLKFIRAILRQEKEYVKRCEFFRKKITALKVITKKEKGKVVVCTIQATNKLVVFNSELLQCLEKLDSRVKPLVLVIKCWARSVGIINMFSSYGFTLLVIFFLQNTNPPVLPPVKKLMDVAGFSRMTAGWQTAFATDEKKIPKSKNTKTVGELLLQFFDYYWNFDFMQNVVSVYLGSPVSLKEFKASANEKLADFSVGSLNIQDPFQLSLNVCGRNSPRILFKLAMYTAYKMLQDSTTTFRMFLNADAYRKSIFQHYNLHLTEKTKVFSINLQHDFEKQLDLSKYMGNSSLWFHRVSESVFDILQYGLLMECEITDKISGGKNGPPGNLKNSQTEVTPYNLELLISIQCISYARTWVGRKTISEVVSNDEYMEDCPIAALKEEYCISKGLIGNESLYNSIPLACFQVECYKHSSPQIHDVVVMLKPLLYCKEFGFLSSFLESYLPKSIKKILVSA